MHLNGLRPTHAQLAAWLAIHGTIRGAAVDRALLESCIAEATDGDKEMADFLRERYTKNDALAAKFMGGYTRTQDYTQKTQKLSEQQKQFEGQSRQLETLRSQLESAETEKNKMMKDLATGRITVAKARAIAETLKTQYSLTDDDLPGLSDLIETAKTHKVVDKTDDLDTRMSDLESRITKSLEEKFVKTLGHELGAMADLDVIWPQIAYEHEQLTGKPMTSKERQEILNAARSGEGGIVAVWEKKFHITDDDRGRGLRTQKMLENERKTWETEREKTEADKRSKDALNVVTGQRDQPDFGEGPGISNAFKTKFRTFEMDPNKPAVADHGGVPSLEVKPGQHVRQTGDRGPSGAQRAAQKFLEQRSAAGTKVTTQAA